MKENTGHSKEPGFDLALAAAIAGYAFEAYSTPTLKQQDKSVFTSDGTKVILTSQKFAELVFSGVLAVTLTSGSFQSGESGADGNIEINLSIEEEASVKTGPGAGFISRQKSARKNGETLYLFLKDSSASSTAILRCTAVDCTPRDSTLLVIAPPVTGTISFLELLKLGCDKKATEINVSLYEEGSGQKTENGAGTLRATVQLFPLRQNGASDPKIKEIFPKINELTATLIPWVRIIVDVFNSEDERSPKDKGCDQTEEKNDENDWTQLDSSSKSDKKNYRVVNGFMDKDTILPDLICCVDNERTGTQASIWTRSADKQIIISFRGTQEPEDILADLNFVPVPYLDSHTDLNVLVHCGFKDCCNSVREALLQILHLLLTSPSVKGQPDHWDIMVTGHSLGGAISSLFSFELARMREGLWGDSDDAAGVYRDDADADSKGFITALKKAGLVNISYGSPRVGNEEFRTMFDKLLEVCVRIINSKDVIPRVPLVGWRRCQGLTMYVGVGRKFQIDMEGGAENSGMWDFITAAPRVLYDVVTFAHYRGHLTKAYQESFLDAAARFKQTGCI